MCLHFLSCLCLAAMHFLGVSVITFVPFLPPTDHFSLLVELEMSPARSDPANGLISHR